MAETVPYQPRREGGQARQEGPAHLLRANRSA